MVNGILMIFYVCFRSGGNKVGFFAGGSFLASTISTSPDKELQCPDDRYQKVDIYVSELIMIATNTQQ